GYEILIGCLFVFTLFSKTTLQWLLIVDIFVYTLIYPVALTFFIIHASYKENKEKLKFLLFGIAVLIPCIVIDSLTAIEVIKFPGTMYFGFTIFLVSISIQLSEEMVQNLKDYLKQEKELIKMEKVKTDFLFNVSNEFKIYMDNFEKLFANSNGNGKGKISKAPKLPLDETDKYVGLILSIFKDAVTLRSIEDKTFTPVITRFSVKQVILECIGLVESALGETRKNKTITISPDAYETTGAKKLFFLIAYHLIENAYKYTKKTDRIQIIFKSENDRAQLQVIDEGPGISKELQSTVFRKFVRGDYLKKESEIAGAGIGLTIVKAVSEYLGGTVELSSSDGFGSRFTVTLPLKAAVQ
ncbi:MAG: sensor histidine kinase, partial [Leptospira sp.]|nr:sensor histidine kinase [Leptospira sp.]